METAESHLFKYLYLIQQNFFGKFTVPGPEGSSAVFTGWILKQFRRKLLFLIFGVKHL